MWYNRPYPYFLVISKNYLHVNLYEYYYSRTPNGQNYVFVEGRIGSKIGKK